MCRDVKSCKESSGLSNLENLETKGKNLLKGKTSALKRLQYIQRPESKGGDSAVWPMEIS